MPAAPLDLLDLLPPGTIVDADGVARVGGCRLDDIAAGAGTPVIVVAEDALRARARAYADGLAQRWPRSRVVFASKSFPCTAVQRVMVQEGLGLDVAGGGEIVTALKAGADPASLVLHGNAKLDEEISLAVDHGLGLVVVDNADDVDRLEATIPRGRTMDVLVRVIPGVTARPTRACSPATTAASSASRPRRRAPSSPASRPPRCCACGGCTCTSGRRSCRPTRSRRPSRRWRPISGLGEFPVYDLGGGLGARYTWADQPASIPAYLDALVGAARAHLPAEAELIIEPGRSMVAEAACTLYRVVTVKRGTRTFVAVDGGMGDNLEVALYDQRFEAGVVGRFDGAGEMCDVVGRHCESGDVLVAGVPLADPAVGDLLVVPATGAYCYTMANNYNGNRRVPVVFAAGGTWRVVVRRETWDDLLRRDVD